jgi:hypothetical protein
MPQSTGPTSHERKQHAAAKVRLLTLDALDHRFKSARRCRDLIAALERELGGSDKLTAGQRELAKRAGIAGAVVEDLETRWAMGEEIDPQLLATMGNSQRRLLAMLGLRRDPPAPSPPTLPSLEDQLVKTYQMLASAKPEAA